MAEDYAQIQPDSTGAKVRTETYTQPVAGVLTEVDTQVVVVADGSEGRILPLSDEVWRHEVLEELKAIRLGLEHMCGGSLRE